MPGTQETLRHRDTEKKGMPRFENTCDFVPPCLCVPKSSYIIILEIPSFIIGTLKFKI